ncbi:MAG: hypothetical protein WCO93_07435 [bacterium]
MKRSGNFLLISLTLLLLMGCSKNKEAEYAPAGLDMKTLKKQYNLAVMDAKETEPWEIYRSLIAVIYYADSTAGQGNLAWSADSLGRQRLLVVSWMSQSSTQYWPLGKTFRTGNSQAHMSWITSSPQILDFLKKNSFTDSSSLHLRIAQLLGMPPDTKNNFFVEYWVYPENLFRPAPDPEITDHEANLYFPGDVSQKHRNWFIHEMLNKYDTGTSTAFPWTRLGYTYDWANPLHPVGMSEFVVDTSSLVTVKSIYSSWQYYQLSLTKK